MRRRRRTVRRTKRSLKLGRDVARARTMLNILNKATDQIEQAQRTLARARTGETQDAQRSLDKVLGDLEATRVFWDKELRRGRFTDEGGGYVR